MEIKFKMFLSLTLGYIVFQIDKSWLNWKFENHIYVNSPSEPPWVVGPWLSALKCYIRIFPHTLYDTVEEIKEEWGEIFTEPPLMKERHEILFNKVTYLNRITDGDILWKVSAYC